jgi:hypothetical protein
MKSSIIFWIGLLIMISCIVLAIPTESVFLLYTASVLPVVFVPFLPDFGSNQYIKPAKQKGQVETIRIVIDAGASPLLLIRFQPGYLRWNKKLLYFSLNDISAYPTLPIRNDLTASLSVLKHDLKRHPRKKDWVGIRIGHLKERTRHMSYTLNEINRLVLRMEDVQEFVSPSFSSSATRGQGQHLQA